MVVIESFTGLYQLLLKLYLEYMLACSMYGRIMTFHVCWKIGPVRLMRLGGNIV